MPVGSGLTVIEIVLEVVIQVALLVTSTTTGYVPTGRVGVEKVLFAPFWAVVPSTLKL